MQVGDQSLKVVRRPEWVCETETARVEHGVIEGGTFHFSLFGLVNPDIVERSAVIIDQVAAQPGEIKYHVVNAPEVTAASHAKKIIAAKEFNQRQSDFDFSFVIPLKGARDWRKCCIAFYSSHTKKRLMDNLDQALQQLYGPAIEEQKSGAVKGSKSELMLQNNQLRQKPSQYRQQAGVNN